MINNICVIGAGTMGHGIAGVFALYGYRVSLFEEYENVRATAPERIQSGLSLMAKEDYISEAEVDGALSNISMFCDLEHAAKDADFVIEAIPEKLSLKKDLFARLDSVCSPHTIFASNTSSLPLGEMISDLSPERKTRTMVCHWYNPAYLIPIAELSFFGNMDEATFREVYDLHISVGKQPVKVLMDIPGLIANRILHAMAREVFNLIEIGAASAEDIDKALKFGPGFRAATAGILETADMGGLDVWCAVEDNLFRDLNNSTSSCDFLRNKVKAGKLGVKSGEGFFTYTDEKVSAARNEFNKRLITQLKASKNYILSEDET